MTDRSCADRIAEQMKVRAEQFAEILAKLDADYDNAYEELDTLPLAISVKRVLRIDLSTGGPGDWIEVEIGEHGQLVGPVEYHFQDWFDHASSTVQHEDDLVAFERFASYFAEVFPAA